MCVYLSIYIYVRVLVIYICKYVLVYILQLLFPYTDIHVCICTHLFAEIFRSPFEHRLRFMEVETDAPKPKLQTNPKSGLGFRGFGLGLNRKP